MNPEPDPEWIGGDLSVGDLIARGIRHIWVNEDNQVLAFLVGDRAFFNTRADERLATIEELGMLGRDVLETGMKVTDEHA